MSDAPSTVVRAQGLGLHALSGLSFSVGPGLTWVRGGEGRGKTTLLRVLAGQLVPATGTLERLPGAPWFEDPDDPAEDDTVAQAWLDTRRRRHRAWDRALEARLAEAFGLAEHLPKPLYMLSKGSRRKVGLVGALASNALLTLVDSPFAALDAVSVRLLTALLLEAAAGAQRAWVVADYECPDALAGVPVIDLGD